MLGAQHQDIGLQTIREQILNRVLCGLGLKLTRSCHIGDKREVDKHTILIAELVAQLTNRLDKGQRLDVAYRTTNLGDDNIVLLRCAKHLNTALNLIGDVGDNLNGLAKELATALLLNHALVDFTRCYIVVLGGLNRGETLVVAEVEVGLRSIFSNIALAVLIGVERTGVDIDIWVELLDSYRVATSLQQTGNRCRDNTFTQ